MEETVNKPEPEAFDSENPFEDIVNEAFGKGKVNPEEQGAENAPVQEEEGLMAQLKQREEQYATLHDSYVRLMAEFDNFRKRTAREKSALMEYASEKVITDLLPVLDDFQRTLTVMEKTDNLSSIQEGIKMVSQRMFRILEKEGLTPIECVGKPFDTNLHEAITSIPAGDDKKGQVVDEAEKGYRLKDKVIRYSKVIVGE